MRRSRLAAAAALFVCIKPRWRCWPNIETGLMTVPTELAASIHTLTSCTLATPLSNRRTHCKGMDIGEHCSHRGCGRRGERPGEPRLRGTRAGRETLGMRPRVPETARFCVPCGTAEPWGGRPNRSFPVRVNCGRRPFSPLHTPPALSQTSCRSSATPVTTHSALSIGVMTPTNAPRPQATTGRS